MESALEIAVATILTVGHIVAPAIAAIWFRIRYGPRMRCEICNISVRRALWQEHLQGYNHFKHHKRKLEAELAREAFERAAKRVQTIEPCKDGEDGVWLWRA